MVDPRDLPPTSSDQVEDQISNMQLDEQMINISLKNKNKVDFLRRVKQFIDVNDEQESAKVSLKLENLVLRINTNNFIFSYSQQALVLKRKKVRFRYPLIRYRKTYKEGKSESFIYALL